MAQATISTRLLALPSRRAEACAPQGKSRSRCRSACEAGVTVVRPSQTDS